jgi:hypothetical protein
MKRKVIMIAAAAVTGITTCLFSINCCLFFSGRHVTYRYVGGAEIGTPEEIDGQLHIPLKLDVNRNAGWRGNSAHCIRSIEVYRNGHKIGFHVRIIICGVCSPVLDPLKIIINKPEPGRYTVVYEDPDGTLHKVGEFTHK